MIRWPIVWTHDGAEAKQRRAGGVRGGSSQGIIMYVLYMINLGSAVWFVWAFLAPLVDCCVVGLGVWPRRAWIKVLARGIWDQWNTPEMLTEMWNWTVSSICYDEKEYILQDGSEIQYQHSSQHTSDGSTQHPASLMNKLFHPSLPNCVTMS